MYNIFSTPIVSLFETLLKGPGSQAVPAGTPADIPLGRSSPFSTFLGALGWDAPRGRGAEGTRGREPERPSCPWAEWPRGLESEGPRGREAEWPPALTCPRPAHLGHQLVAVSLHQMPSCEGIEIVVPVLDADRHQHPLQEHV